MIYFDIYLGGGGNFFMYTGWGPALMDQETTKNLINKKFITLIRLIPPGTVDNNLGPDRL